MKRHLWTSIAVTLALAGTLFAQGRRHDRPPNRGPERISRVIADCEDRTDRFRVSLRRALERSSFRGSAREDELNQDADRLERALNRVREAWNRERDVPRTRSHVSAAIDVSRNINRTMTRRRLNPDVQRQWEVVRGELNRLAEAFDLPRIRWDGGR